MNFEDRCGIKGCDRPAKKLGSGDTGNIIEMCNDCWDKKYRS